MAGVRFGVSTMEVISVVNRNSSIDLLIYDDDIGIISIRIAVTVLISSRTSQQPMNILLFPRSYMTRYAIRYEKGQGMFEVLVYSTSCQEPA
jgi:hypothetical protein